MKLTDILKEAAKDQYNSDSATPPILYHTSSANRHSIKQNGLMASKNKEGLTWLTTQPKSKIGGDVWAVSTKNLELEFDKDTGTEKHYVTTQDIKSPTLSV